MAASSSPRPLSKIENTPRASGSKLEATGSTLCKQCGMRIFAPGSRQFCTPCHTKDAMRRAGRPYSEIARAWMRSTAEYEREQEILAAVKPEPENNSAALLKSSGPERRRCSECHVLVRVPKPGGVCELCRFVNKGHELCDLPVPHTRPNPEATTMDEAPAKTSSQVSEIALGKRRADAMQESQIATSLIQPCTDFQTRTAMYEELGSRVRMFYKASKMAETSVPYVLFHGAYSIIADPAVSNKTRLTLVSQELQKIVKLPHSRDTPARAGSSSSYTMLCLCECNVRHDVRPILISSSAQAGQACTSTPAAPSIVSHTPHSSVSKPARSVPPLVDVHPPAKKPRQSTLSQWILRQGTKKEAVPHSTPTNSGVPSLGVSGAVAPSAAAPKAVPVERSSVCGGTVRITVVDDLSHAYFKGQRIVIEVSHPQDRRQ